ncbi:MAG TPA: DUF86 domain-containing protein [Ktedonobacterales bacterium]|nr:DUF86 domain-containing protein [Ktedonobacterales bacterium]
MTTPGATPPLRDPRIILDEIVASITMIESYLAQVTRDEFMAQPLVQDGVVRRLEIIGEAATQLPADLKARFTAVEWRAMTTMRNRLIHGYFAVNLTIVWDTIQRDLPVLETQIRAIRSQLDATP